MFSGIIKEIGILEKRRANKFYFYSPKLREELRIGSSIAVNGVCLTVIELTKFGFCVFVMDITLKNTNLGLLFEKEEVNLEPAIRLGEPIGGHLISGQIDTCVKLTRREWMKDGSLRLRILLNNTSEAKRVKEKSYIGVEGVSLTVAKLMDKNIILFLTPYTAKETTLGKKRIGTILNVEFYNH